MEIREFENLVCSQVTEVVQGIIADNKFLKIAAKSRAGAEISDWLEEQFVKDTQTHKYIIGSEFAPKGKTKNPWDVRCYFCLKEHREEIWIDFKAFKLSGEDSNPDIGTPNKIIKFIEEGGFYLLYVHVYYREHINGLEFVQSGGDFVKSYFLKDISSTFRRTPTNQLQVNMSAKPTYRTRNEFIDILMEKLREGLIRQLKKSKEKLTEIDEKTALLKEINTESEKIILEKIQ